MQASHCVAGVSLCLALACAQAPPPPGPGRVTLHGTLELVPRAGLKPPAHGSVHYGDRRLRDVDLVDYSKPGFAVVYLDSPEPPGGRRELTVRETRGQVRIEPRYAAAGLGGEIAVLNKSASRHVVSCPAAGVLQWIGPGESLSIPAESSGSREVFLLDVAEAQAQVFVAPGPYVVVASNGRWVLPDVAPGERRLRAWHPRLPPADLPVQLAPGAIRRFDLKLGVDFLAGGEHDGD